MRGEGTVSIQLHLLYDTNIFSSTKMSEISNTIKKSKTVYLHGLPDCFADFSSHRFCLF